MLTKDHQEPTFPHLSPRLCQVAAQVPRGVPFADVGTDHAYLPISLVQSGHTPYAIAVEVRKGPYQRALKAVQEAGLSARISVRLGDGLQALAAAEVHTIVLAGMGGELMRRLLTAEPGKTLTFQRLVLQPNMASHFVRRALLAHGWKLRAEKLVLDCGHLYEILAYEQGLDDSYQTAAQALSQIDDLAFLKEDWFLLFLLGPRILLEEWLQKEQKSRRGLLVCQRIRYESDKRRRILEGLRLARHREREKMDRLEKELIQLEVLAQCMHTLRQ